MYALHPNKLSLPGGLSKGASLTHIIGSISLPPAIYGSRDEESKTKERVPHESETILQAQWCVVPAESAGVSCQFQDCCWAAADIGGTAVTPFPSACFSLFYPPSPAQAPGSHCPEPSQPRRCVSYPRCPAPTVFYPPPPCQAGPRTHCFKNDGVQERIRPLGDGSSVPAGRPCATTLTSQVTAPPRPLRAPCRHPGAAHDIPVPCGPGLSGMREPMCAGP